MPSLSPSSASSFIQYTIFAVIVYFLAGAPLSSLMVESNAGGGTSVGSVSVGQEKLDSLVVPEKGLRCGEHKYRGVHILSREPLVVYIEGFLGDEEARHVVEVSNPLFTPSTIWNGGQETLNTAIRNSSKAQLPRDHTVKCIEDRARAFQGWRPFVFVEKLWAQKYGTGGHYTYHYDWSTATKMTGRVSSFMVYLEANCTGGGTHFPRLKHPGKEGEWCRFIECLEGSGVEDGMEDPFKDGVIFKPVAGNAVYWENMRSDGSGYRESWHAGLPVESGMKIGLNIWNWRQVGYVPSGDKEEEKE